MKTLLVFILMTVVMSSCSHFNNNNLFDGMDIKLITDTLPVLHLNNNSVLKLFQNKNVIMVHYFNGNCSYCISGIVKRVNYVDSILGKNIGLLFIAESEDTASLNYMLDRIRFGYPVLYDVEHRFYQWNKKIIDRGIKTFLINNEGNILIQGDPVNNKKIENKYFKIIRFN